MYLSQLLTKRIPIFVLLLTLIGAALHFYNLNWGAPFYFHPDERNIASAVSQLQFPKQMNPHFFAYGSLPLYSIYFTGMLLSQFQAPFVSFELAIQISRFYSALFATLLIPVLFFIGKKLKNEPVGVITAFLATTSVGFIQFSHFGTFEMWLTFFSVLLFLICLQKFTKKNLLLMGIIFGTLVATKVSSLVLLPLLFLILFIKSLSFRATEKESKNLMSQKLLGGMRSFHSLRSVGMTIKKILFVSITAFLVYYSTNLFVFLDANSFINSMHYESSVVLGTLEVFYTGEFFNTIPLLFQFTNSYPFLLNPLITSIVIPSVIYFFIKTIKTKNTSYFLLFAFFSLFFFSQIFFFAKWTRYMMPTLPFIFLIVAIAISDVIVRRIPTKQSQNEKQKLWRLPRSLQSLAMTFFIGINILFAFSYFITAFVHTDTRVEAYQFAQKTIPSSAPILSEVYDLGIVPFNESFPNIALFNFYELDNHAPDWTNEKLTMQLLATDYIILPSQRILKTSLLNQKQFPKAHIFYGYVLNKRNPQTLVALTSMPSYKQIYETPCDIFCQITYLGDSVFRYEQTTNVFDRPTVMIFKKIQ